MRYGKESQQPSSALHLSPILDAVFLRLTLMVLILAAGPARAQNYKVLYGFTAGADGGQPMAGLISDEEGNLYGTTQSGGISTGPCAPGGCGVVFKVDPNGKETVLYRFNGGADGVAPAAALVRDTAGNLFGTTTSGGTCSWPYSSNGCGVIFKLDATTGQETVLYTFTGGADGAVPGPLLLDTAGILYGTTTSGGGDAYGRCQAIGCGIVFKLDPSTSTFTVLYSFTGASDGGGPVAALIEDSTGNLYGTTSSGGANVSVCGGFGCGVVFKLDTTGNNTVLYTFMGQADGGTPVAALVQDAGGNFYGTTENGGTYGWGVVFKLDSTGKETILHEFTGGADGATPRGGLVSDPAGNLYGTTLQGGTGTFFTNGVIFKLDTSGNFTALHTLAANGTEGINPYAGLLMDPAGNLYGTASEAGPSCPANAATYCGVVFEVTGILTSFNVQIGIAGTGAGTVTSNPASIDCGSICSANFADGTSVTLTASAATGSTFAGWSGSCTGTGGCTLNAGGEVSATFNELPSDFSLTAASPSLTLEPGKQGTDVITIAPQNTFANAIQLSCTVAGPSPVPSCSLSPSSVTPGANPANSTLMISASTLSVRSFSPDLQRFLGSLTALWLPLALGGALSAALKKQNRPLRFLSGLLFVLLLLQTACSGNGGGGQNSATYTVTVVGTSSTLQHSTQVVVTVP